MFGYDRKHTHTNPYENVLSQANVSNLAAKWIAPILLGTISSPAVVNGVVYIGSDDGSLYAFNAQTGTQLWRVTTGSNINSSPAVVNGVVYVGSHDSNVYAFNARTGIQLWKAPTGADIAMSSPVVINSVVYIGSEDQNVYAFNAQTGANSGRPLQGVRLAPRPQWSMVLSTSARVIAMCMPSMPRLEPNSGRPLQEVTPRLQ